MKPLRQTGDDDWGPYSAYSGTNETWKLFGISIAASSLVLVKEIRTEFSHGWGAFMFWGIGMMAASSLLMLLGGLFSIIFSKGNRERRKEALALIKAAFPFSPSLIAFCIATYGDRVLPFLTRVLGLYGMRSVVLGTVIGLGFCAHFWKRKYQYTYGVGELIFACMATAFIASRIVPGQSVLSQWVALGGAVYVIARGLNNISEAREKAIKAEASAAL